MIDWDKVGELRDAVGPGDFRDVVEIFLEEVDDAMSALSPGTVGPDELHFLKGCALNLGFRAVSGLCAELERRIAGGTLTAREIEELRDSYARSRAAFLERAPDVSAA